MGSVASSTTNDDKFLLHLYNYIQEWLGNQHATRVKTAVRSENDPQKEIHPLRATAMAAHGRPNWSYFSRSGQE